MRVLISADMEGATGVTCPADVIAGTPQFERFRTLLTGDVNAAVEGCFAGGASRVLVNEAHCGMRNVLLERLDPRAELLTGRHKLLSMMEGIDAADAVVFIGYHTGSGEPGVLAHTYLSDALVGVWVNGEPATEGRMNALLAEEYGVPVVLVTGDDLTCADAATYAPSARTVAVKDAVSRYAAICRPPTVTADAIRSAAKAAVESAEESAAGPIGEASRDQAAGDSFTYEVEFDAAHLPDAVAFIPTVEVIGPRRVRWTAETMREAIRCFKAVVGLANAAREQPWT